MQRKRLLIAIPVILALASGHLLWRQANDSTPNTPSDSSIGDEESQDRPLEVAPVPIATVPFTAQSEVKEEFPLRERLKKCIEIEDYWKLREDAIAAGASGALSALRALDASEQDPLLREVACQILAGTPSESQASTKLPLVGHPEVHYWLAHSEAAHAPWTIVQGLNDTGILVHLPIERLMGLFPPENQEVHKIVMEDARLGGLRWRASRGDLDAAKRILEVVLKRSTGREPVLSGEVVVRLLEAVPAHVIADRLVQHRADSAKKPSLAARTSLLIKGLQTARPRGDLLPLLSVLEALDKGDATRCRSSDAAVLSLLSLSPEGRKKLANHRLDNLQDVLAELSPDRCAEIIAAIVDTAASRESSETEILGRELAHAISRAIISRFKEPPTPHALRHSRVSSIIASASPSTLEATSAEYVMALHSLHAHLVKSLSGESRLAYGNQPILDIERIFRTSALSEQKGSIKEIYSAATWLTWIVRDSPVELKGILSSVESGQNPFGGILLERLSRAPKKDLEAVAGELLQIATRAEDRSVRQSAAELVLKVSDSIDEFERLIAASDEEDLNDLFAAVGRNLPGLVSAGDAHAGIIINRVVEWTKTRPDGQASELLDAIEDGFDGRGRFREVFEAHKNELEALAVAPNLGTRTRGRLQALLRDLNREPR